MHLAPDETVLAATDTLDVELLSCRDAILASQLRGSTICPFEDTLVFMQGKIASYATRDQLVIPLRPLEIILEPPLS